MKNRCKLSWNLLLAVLMITLGLTCEGQVSAQRVHTRIYLDPTSSVPSARSILDIVYHDGFQEFQRCLYKGSPGGDNIIITKKTGILGRVEREYLPYTRPVGLGENNLDSTWFSLYGRKECQHAFTHFLHDGSPLNLVVKETGPGAAWHENERGVTRTRSTNEVNEVKIWRVKENGSLFLAGTYPAGTLTRERETDEDGLVTDIFSDGAGRAILQVATGKATRLETYHVYDRKGLSRFVLPPEACRLLGTTVDSTVLDRYAYRYRYDGLDRLVEKKLPGCAPVYMVYDGRDRLVLSQDGKQRATNTRTWSYSLYDNQNRVVETGEISLAGTVIPTHAGLQAAASSVKNYVPAGTRTAFQYTLHDTYTASANVPVRPFTASTGYATGFHRHVIGLVTGVRTRVLETGDYLTSTIYYDERGRMIQTVTDNLQQCQDRIDVRYDFVGNVERCRECHEVSDGRVDILETVNVHDNRGRLLTSTTRLNGESPAVVTRVYDDLGRLVSRKAGNVTETMTYNPRGWLTSKESPVFKMKLRHECPTGGNAARWNGNVSEWEWQHGTNTAVQYGFTYDEFNRLIDTRQQQRSGLSWVNATAGYVEKGITYDDNGNIKTLVRTAGGTTVDNLVYTCTGNRLTGLTENARTSPANDIYSPGSVAHGSYIYDLNGNMINDSRRALNFSYNVLNLLSEVRTTAGNLKAKYAYLADGTKLRVRDDGDVNGFDYLGSLTYKKSSSGLQLESASFGEGVIRVTGSNSGENEVDYFLTDHLGSVRVIVDGNGVVKERNDYYPFGARHVRGDYPQGDGNRFKYNGKEEQVTGDLKYLDYGARMGDLALGRWFSMDPLSGNYLSLSPYHFSGNNPVLFVDMNGMDYWTTSDPGEIARFFSLLRGGNANVVETFDYSDWARFSDSDVLGILTLNDETKKLYSSYGTVIEGVATSVGVSLDINTLFRHNAFVVSRQEVFDQVKKREWYKRSSGAIQQDYTIDALFIPVGKGISTITSLFGRVGGNVYKSVGAAAARNLDKVIQTGGHTIKNSTAKALGLSKGQLKNAIERLKKYNRMRHDSHQKIMGNGDVIDSHTGKYIDNLYDYVD